MPARIKRDVLIHHAIERAQALQPLLVVARGPEVDDFGEPVRGVQAAAMLISGVYCAPYS